MARGPGWGGQRVPRGPIDLVLEFRRTVCARSRGFRFLCVGPVCIPAWLGRGSAPGVLRLAVAIAIDGRWMLETLVS
jgi:hypothetical protein